MISFTDKFLLHGDVCCGDKSISHRALICASVATSPSTIRNVSLCQDVLSTANCLRALGATITFCGNIATVTPITKPTDGAVLDCGNSGTTARLLAGLVAGLGVKATFVGDKSLQRRPMDRVLKPLAQLGAQFSFAPNALFVCNGGKLLGCKLTASVNSAQVKSAVLLAGLFAQRKTTYEEQIATRNHTELLLQQMGAQLTTQGNACTVARSALHGVSLTVPNDTSSVAYLVALAVLKKISHTFTNVLLNPLRCGFFDVLTRAGANVTFTNIRSVCGEVVGDVVVKPSVVGNLCATQIDVCNGIDEVVLLATVALAIKGKHTFCGVDELRCKECDRVQALLTFAKQCNQQATYANGNLTVQSNGVLPKRSYYHCFDDHRMAMCQAVLCLASGGGSVDGYPYQISFPNFLQSVGVTPLRFGLVGSDVTTSKSPILMAHLAQQAKVCCTYDAYQMPQDASDEQLLQTIDRLDGVNVTMPFKMRVAQLYKEQRPVNTVGKNVSAQSTDGYGVTQAIAKRNLPLANAPVWLVGAGGSAESCLQQLVLLGCNVQIINRTEQHAMQLAKKYGASQNVPNPVAVLTFVPQCQFEQQITLPPSVQYVFVASYKRFSGVKNQAQRRGLPVVDGLEMLYFQGAKSFSLWTNTPVQDDFESFDAFLQEQTQ